MNQNFDKRLDYITEEEYNKIKKKSSFYVEKYGQLQNLEGVYKIKLTKFQELKNKYGRCFELEIKVHLLSNVDLDQMRIKVKNELNIDKKVFEEKK